MTLDTAGSVTLGDILMESIDTCTCITGYENMGPIKCNRALVSYGYFFIVAIVKTMHVHVCIIVSAKWLTAQNCFRKRSFQSVITCYHYSPWYFQNNPLQVSGKQLLY